MSEFKSLTLEHKPNEQLIGLLEDNIIGTPGESMLYRHQNIRSKVSTIPAPYYANLYIRKRLYGSICLSKRNVLTLGKKHQAFYLRYFTFRERFRSTNIQQRKNDSSSLIREDVINLMNGKGLHYHGDLVLYAYVDPENIRSKRLIDEFGFKKIGEFNTIPFSRICTKISSRVEKVVEKDLEYIYRLLKGANKKEQLVSLDNLFTRGEYFVIRENSTIICGVQAIRDSWEIIDLPGISGRFMISVVPGIPFIGRLFKPRYEFVFLESLFCVNGKEKELGILLESVLAFHNLNSGILCLDPKSPLYSKVKQINLGLTHKVMGEKKIEIVVKTSDQEIFNQDLPFFVSGHDVL